MGEEDRRVGVVDSLGISELATSCKFEKDGINVGWNSDEVVLDVP